jgi:hypothetical protein
MDKFKLLNYNMQALREEAQPAQLVQTDCCADFL